MTKNGLGWKALGVTAGGAAALASGGLALRPWYLRWGATDEEVRRDWPGDELCPEAASVATHAITIYAPLAHVWAWIAQIGQDRGGFYSYSWLENLFGAQIHNADRILEGHQHRQVGETVWMAPPHRYGGRGCTRISRLDPGRVMVLVSPEDYEEVRRTGIAPGGSWAFILEALDEQTTRFVVRSRSGPRKSLFRNLVFDPIHFIMERKMMLGIRDRAEAAVLAQA